MKLKKQLLRITIPFFKITSQIFGDSKLSKFYPLEMIYFHLRKYVLKNLKSNYAIVQGHKMFLDSEDSLNLSAFGIYEDYETYLTKKYVRSGNIVLDIGANIGYYTLIFAKIVGNKGKVYAYEPDPANFELLKKNVEINGYKNVELIQKAVSNENGISKLYINEDNKGDHRLFDSQDGRSSIKVEVIKLDDYFENYNGNIDFIKIDIQGSEMKAAEGMVKILEKNENIKLISEFSPSNLEKSGSNPLSYINFLLDNNFQLYYIDSNKKRINNLDVDELYKKIRIKGYANILCTKGM